MTAAATIRKTAGMAPGRTDLEIRALSLYRRYMLITGIRRMCEDDSSCSEKRARAVSAFQETMTEAATNPAKYQCRRVAEPEVSCIFFHHRTSRLPQRASP